MREAIPQWLSAVRLPHVTFIIPKSQCWGLPCQVSALLGVSGAGGQPYQESAMPLCWGSAMPGVSGARGQPCWGSAVPGVSCAGGQQCWGSVVLRVSRVGLCLQLWPPISVPPASFYLMTAGHLHGKIDGCCHSAGVPCRGTDRGPQGQRWQLQSGWELVWGFRGDRGSSLRPRMKCSCHSVLLASSSSLPSWKPASSPCQDHGPCGLSCSSTAPPLPAPRDERGGSPVSCDPSAGSGLLSLP